MWEKLLKKNEAVLACLILLIIVVFSLISPQFRTVNTLFNIIRAMLITSILAIPCLLVFISGGIDMSFMAIASVSMYSVVKLFTIIPGEHSIWLMFLVGIGVGIVMGLINSFFVIITKLPPFIVTLGTQFIFHGACLAFVGKQFLQVPRSMVALSGANLITYVDATESTIGVNVSVVFVVLLYVATFFMLKYTRFGRSLYAIGGNPDAARRAGINVTRNTIGLFALVGAISAVGGVLNGSLLRLAVPGDLVGNELTVIAAVILGGADPARGKGTVLGTILGVLLITIISNSLNLLKIPSYWQEAVIGVIIILGTVFGKVAGSTKRQLKSI